MKKKLLTLLVCLTLTSVSVFAQGTSESSTASANSGKKKISVAFVLKDMNSPYFKALSESLRVNAKKNGWDYSLLLSDGNTEKESENIDSLLSRGVDLIYLDCIDPDPAIALIQRCSDAGVPVIAVDSGVGKGAKTITTVYSDNLQNGREVGLKYAEKIGKEGLCKAILLSGNKGNPAGRQRRDGLFCGIIEGRLGISESEAWELAYQMEKDVINKGKAFNKEANFEIAGQAYGDWSVDGGLRASEDLITANKDLTCALGENDMMLFGTIKALDNAGIAGVDLVAAADGAKQAYDYIKEGKYFGTGENSPTLIGQKAASIAEDVLLHGIDPTSYPEITMTDAIAVTAENVDARYQYGF